MDFIKHWIKRNNKMRPLLIFSLFVLLQSCASNQFIVDKKGVDETQYQADLEECKAYAEQLKTGKTVAKSAGFGALVGVAIGAALGDSDMAARMAGAGAVQGGAGGAIDADRSKDDIVKSCLAQRGYRVLN
jgi:uncharacterized protein YcfJ